MFCNSETSFARIEKSSAQKNGYTFLQASVSPGRDDDVRIDDAVRIDDTFGDVTRIDVFRVVATPIYPLQG